MRFILAHLSDPHVSDVARKDGRRPAETLARALSQAGQEGADAILITGDLVQDGRPGEYAVLRHVLKSAPVPVFLLPGNHDDPETLRDCFPDHEYFGTGRQLSYALNDFPVRILVLDQHLPGAVGGLFDAENEAWLRAQLAQGPRRPTIVALHHPPFPTYDQTFDKIGLDGADRFAAVIADHSQVMRVLCGHFHRAALASVGGTVAVIAPSTAWAFKLELEAGAPVLTQEQPLGFALHVWTPDAGCTTHFIWF
jgi:3',5'-cyclic-AMP phosphodiesterase